MKIKGQKPNSEVNSHQQIALLVTNHFFSSFAPILKRVSFHCPKNSAKPLAIWLNLHPAPFSRTGKMPVSLRVNFLFLWGGHSVRP
jgi:hypothetical protein